MGVFPVIGICIAVLVAAPVVFLFLSRGSRHGKPAAAGAAHDAAHGAVPGAATVDTKARAAARRIAQNPRDARALLALAEAAYKAGDWEASRQKYRALLDLSAAEPDLDETEISLRHGMAAFRAGALDEAKKSLEYARTKREFTFEPSFSLGCLEARRGNLEKAAGYFNRAHQADPDNLAATKQLGESLFALGHYHDSIPLLSRAFEQLPDDRALLFRIGRAYAETDKADEAARIFSRLRTDPALGPRAALLSAQYQVEKRQYDRAIEDIGIGLRHPGADRKTVLELKYRLGGAWLRKGDIGKALVSWKEIAETESSYRDVPELLARYREIGSNSRLRAYLMSPVSEFVTLCRRLVAQVYPRSRVKIVSVSIRQSEFLDIAAEVDAGSWKDTVLFRFVRASGVIGEPPLRDMYARTRDLKAGRGVCIAPGSYSPGAKAFVEGRVLELLDKQGLLKLLARVPWGGA
jgi:tetratricopeptide (TPR) repeat protein